MEQHEREPASSSDVLSERDGREEYEDSSGASSSSDDEDYSKAGQSSDAAVPAASNVVASPGTSARRIMPTQVIAGKRIVPVQFQYCEMDDILELVASMLVKIITYNDTLNEERPLTRFHSKAAPGITPLAYLKRIQMFTNTDPCIIIILLYYIDKLSANYLTMTSLTIHRFLIAAICCGTKALSDSFATNSRYAKVGGVELLEMNALEREFLIAIDWRLATSGVLLEQYWRGVVNAHDGYLLQPMAVPHPHLQSVQSTVTGQGHIAGPAVTFTSDATSSPAATISSEEHYTRHNKRAKA